MGYESFADAVGRALAIIERTAGLAAGEFDAARAAATSSVTEVVKPEPDRRVLKSMLVAIRGVRDRDFQMWRRAYSELRTGMQSWNPGCEVRG